MVVGYVKLREMTVFQSEPNLKKKKNWSVEKKCWREIYIVEDMLV